MTGRTVVNHVGLVVSDLPRSRRFYEELLGFQFWREISPGDGESAKLLGLEPPLDSTIAYLRRDEFVLELIHYGAPAHRPEFVPRRMDDLGLTHLSISCDVRAVVDRVEEYGGEVLTETDVEVAIFVRDPDGQLLELLPLAYADRVAKK